MTLPKVLLGDSAKARQDLGDKHLSLTTIATPITLDPQRPELQAPCS